MSQSVICSTSCNPNDMDYRPFVENGKQWIVVYATNKIYWVKDYYLAQDTIVANHSCKKLMCHYINYEDVTNATKLYAIIFEENKQVFYYPPEVDPSVEPIMLYDFGARAGDVVFLGGNPQNLYQQNSYLIQDTLVIENNNDCFRGVQAFLNDGSYTIIEGDTVHTEFQWYESIGSIFEPFEKFEWNRYMGGPPRHLYECRVNNEIIYSNTMGLTLSTNAIEYSPIIPVEKKIINDQLYILRGDKTYTLTGQEVK